MNLAAPLVLAAHVAKLPTLPGWAADADRAAVAVYEGAAVRRDDVREWATVGYVAGADGPVVVLEPVRAGQGQTTEAGSVTSQLVVGADTVAAARDRVFDLLAAWAGWLAEDRTLADADGRARLLPGSDVHLAVDVTLITTRAGATANAVVTATYQATTYG